MKTFIVFFLMLVMPVTLFAAEEVAEEGMNGWLAIGMIFFGLVSFIPYIYMRIKFPDKKSEK